MFLEKNYKNITKCEHRIWLVKRKYGQKVAQQLRPNPYNDRKSKSKRKQILLLLLLFFLLSIYSLSWNMFTKDELDILSLCSSSIYCRYASIRYEINPSFAQQTYRAEGISSCVSNISKIPWGIYLDAWYSVKSITLPMPSGIHTHFVCCSAARPITTSFIVLFIVLFIVFFIVSFFC